VTVGLRLGDCLEVMPSIEAGSVDMILADLPYGTTACKWDTVIPLVPLWAEYKRVIKRNGAIVLTASQPFTTTLIASNMGMFRYSWVWDKALSTGFLDANRKPLKQHEDVVVFYQEQSTYNPQKRRGDPYTRPRSYANAEVYSGDFERLGIVNVTGERFPTSILTISNAHQAAKVHKTQKPVALMEYLIRTYTNEGETVLDNAMGSGTTGVACVNTGRSFIGIEKDEEYFQIAVERIRKAQEAHKQLELAV
jgi:DNA modification methylase